MSNNSSLHQLKQKYRARYYGNRFQDIPDLKPWDNAVSFVNNYLNVTASISDGEDCEKSNVIRRSPSEHKTDNLRIQQNREGSEDSSESGVNDVPQTSQGDGHSVTKSDPLAILNTLKKNEKQPDLTNDKLFSDDESDNEESDVVAKLIEKSLSENDNIVDKSEKPREILYSSDTSVVQEPPSPTSNIHAKKWLSFKDATFALNDNVFTNIVSRTSEEFTNIAQQSRRETLNYNNNENPNRANITYDLHIKSTDNGPNNEFLIEEESSCNLDAWISPYKKKTASPLSTRPKEDKPAPTPKKTNTVEASSSLQKKSENVKASPIRSTTSERLKTEFVIEEESICNLETWISPYKKKTASPLSTRPKEDKPAPTPKKTNTVEASRSLQKKSENVKASRISSVTTESMVNAEKKTNDPNARKMSFSNIFFKAATAGHIGNRLSSVISEAPTAPSAVSSNEEEFEIEDISEINVSKLLTIPVKKPAQTGRVSKKEKSVPVEVHPIKSVNRESSHASVPSHTGENEYLLQEAALPRVVEGTEQLAPLSQDSALQRVVEGIEKPVTLSQDTHWPRVVEGIEGEESIHQEDDLPVENQEEKNVPLENTNLNHVKQVQQSSNSSRKKAEWSAKKIFGDLDETFTIRSMKGKGKTKLKTAAKKTKQSKQLKEKQEEHQVKEKKVKKNKAENKTRKSDKQGISLQAKNELETAKDCMSNDLETEEILETSTTNCASRKRKHTDKAAKADVKKNAEVSVCKQPHNEGSEIGYDDEQQTMTDARLLLKKRKAKMKFVSPPCPADHSKEESVFQSGPVIRQKAVRFAGPVKPLACDLDSPDVESGGEEGHVSGEDDERNFSSGEQLAPLDCSVGPKRDFHISEKERVTVEHFIDGPKTDAQISEEQKEFLNRYSIVFDPDTKSDALVECIAQSEKSKYVGSDSSTYWFSFNNNIFTTGKLIIAPKKTSERRVFMSDIVIYYVEQGRVQLNLHKTERILKNGDFFFVPPGNGCTITNLQDTEAVLVFNLLKMLPLSTEG